eukprot:m.132936 g.132936  ORF g.132936 m.132936 type:complete len:234 (+) comp15789_c3_seq2:297-998(+)
MDAMTLQQTLKEGSWPDPLWVFGYGSLIWKVDFEHEEAKPCYIRGYIRRFYQYSTDHRGVPGAPGRVVTLLQTQQEEDIVWGMAYRIHPDKADTVMAHLDYREKGGYKPLHIEAFTSSQHHDIETQALKCLVYVGTEDNPQYTGVREEEEIARVIAAAVGPSGPNSEYLLNLATALRNVAPHHEDDHITTLETLVLKFHHEEKKCSAEAGDSTDEHDDTVLEVISAEITVKAS